MASFEFVNFRGSDTILGTLAQLDRGITKRCKNLKFGCTLHVLGTCAYFIPLFISSRLQAKPIDGHGSNFVIRQPSGWALALVVTVAKRHKQHVPEGVKL